MKYYKPKTTKKLASKKRYIKWTLLGLILVGASLHLSLRFNLDKLGSRGFEFTQAEIRRDINSQIAEHLIKNEYPQTINLDNSSLEGNFHVKYTLDQELQVFTDKLIKSYKPDYAAVVVLDAITGQVLTISSYARANDFARNLAMHAGYPAASIFKIIPASAAIDKYKYGSDMTIGVNGSYHTLYRRNVMAETVNRWTRYLTLEDAFALSVNTAFARLALGKLEPHDLEEYARKFLFNQPILTDFFVEVSEATIPHEKNYNLAEVASGFNKENKLSPVQGAMIAASIANDGVMQLPYIVQSITKENGENFLFQPTELSRPLSPEGAEELRELMQATVYRGTSKKSFRKLVKNKKLMPMEVGGKTGSLTGGNPHGKVDWFVGYAMKDNRKISIAAITVNKEFWTVKSAYLSQEIFKKYFSAD